MTKDWLVKKDDLDAAAVIINKRVAMREDHMIEPLDLMLPFDNEELIDIPDWVADIAEYFVEKYGIEKGEQIANHIIMKYLTADQTIH